MLPCPKDVVIDQNICYPSGDSTDSLGLTAEGITERVLFILVGLMSLLVWVLEITFTAVCLCYLGKHLPV